ncbi:MAG TPA: aldehyde dehydrogenase family protein, partial [Parvularculaceae bacterium]|nr:aldehyde dehydrogenase family protein [Parvularculaceae bacterium]
MTVITLKNYALGKWTEGKGALADIPSAVTGEVVARGGSGGLDFKKMAEHARDVGGANLRKLTFHERAAIVKALAQAVMEKKEELYQLNFHTGATRKDGWIDIEGGAGTFFSMASKAKRELPDGYVLADGGVEQISREGTFLAQ